MASREYNRAHYLKHRAHLLAKAKAWRHTPKGRAYQRAYNKTYWIGKEDRLKETRKLQRMRLKAKVLSIYGGECEVCHSENDIRALSIDHALGAGKQDRRRCAKWESAWYRYLLRMGVRRADLRCACMSCQFKLKHGGEKMTVKDVLQEAA